MGTNQSIVQNDDVKDDGNLNSENAELMLQLGLGGGSESYQEQCRLNHPHDRAPLFGLEEIRSTSPYFYDSGEKMYGGTIPYFYDSGLRNDLFKWSTFDPRLRHSIVPNDDGSQVEQGDSGCGGSIARQIIGDSNRASSEASLSTPRSHHLPNNSQQLVHIESLPAQLAQREQVIQEKNVQINASLMQTDSSGTSVAGKNHRKRLSKVKAWIGLTKKKEPRGTKNPNHHGN